MAVGIDLTVCVARNFVHIFTVSSKKNKRFRQDDLSGAGVTMLGNVDSKSMVE